MVALHYEDIMMAITSQVGVNSCENDVVQTDLPM